MVNETRSGRISRSYEHRRRLGTSDEARPLLTDKSSNGKEIPSTTIAAEPTWSDLISSNGGHVPPAGDEKATDGAASSGSGKNSNPRSEEDELGDKPESEEEEWQGKSESEGEEDDLGKREGKEIREESSGSDSYESRTHLSVREQLRVSKRKILKHGGSPSPKKQKTPIIARSQIRSRVFSIKEAQSRYESFSNRNIIAERLVDFKKNIQWGYHLVITDALFAPTVSIRSEYVREVITEFYSNLGDAKHVDTGKGVFVFVRGHLIEFSPVLINKYLKLPELSPVEVRAAAKADSISLNKVACYLLEKRGKTSADLRSRDLPPRNAVLAQLAAYNWFPTTHRSHVSQDRARLIYKLAHHVRVDFELMVYEQVMGLRGIQKNDSLKLVFLHLIYGLIQDQRELPLRFGESLISPVYYHKDRRTGHDAVKEEAAEAKLRTKSKGKATSLKPSTSTAAETESSEDEEVIDIVQLGSICVPKGPASRKTICEALERSALILHKLTEVVQDLQQAMEGGDNEQSG